MSSWCACMERSFTSEVGSEAPSGCQIPHLEPCAPRAGQVARERIVGQLQIRQRHKHISIPSTPPLSRQRPCQAVVAQLQALQFHKGAFRPPASWEGTCRERRRRQCRHSSYTALAPLDGPAALPQVTDEWETGHKSLSNQWILSAAHPVSDMCAATADASAPKSGECL